MVEWALSAFVLGVWRIKEGIDCVGLGRLKMADSLCMPGRSDKDFEDRRILGLHMLLGVWGFDCIGLGVGRR